MRQRTQTDGTRPSLCHAGSGKPAAEDGVEAALRANGGVGAARRPASTPVSATRLAPPAGTHNFSRAIGSKLVGAAFEQRAQEFLQRQRLRLVARNVTCRGGEIDLVMRDRDGTLVFVEVRARAQRQYGGAAASIGGEKQRRIVHAAQHYLAQRGNVSQDQPACRFDVIAFESGRLTWLRDAFRADEL